MLCKEFYYIWEKIAHSIGLYEKYIFENYIKFIGAIVKRRNNNIHKWFQELTGKFKELKGKYQNFNNVKDNSLLDNIWKICGQKCRDCYSKCFLLKGHKNHHQCFYDHKCKKKCTICSSSDCKENECTKQCIYPLNHPETHSCGHFHQCKEDCSFKKNTLDCKGGCILEYGHKNHSKEQKHFCGLREHHCKGICSYSKRSRNCNKKCKQIYPHKSKGHNCGTEHLCGFECELKNKAKGCKSYCKKIWGHEDSQHICEGKHFCIQKCSLEKNKGCKEQCSLEYYHEGDHLCGGIHFCKEKCDLFNRSRGCDEWCKLEYPHPEKIHLCKNKEEHYCLGECVLKERSLNCKEKCSLKYEHKGNCICENKKEKHICNKKCSIHNNEGCFLEIDHCGICLCKECSCPKKCELYESRNCKEICQFKAGHTGEHKCNVTNHLCNIECKYKNLSRNCNNICDLEYNHQGEEHICSSEHYYKEICIYQLASRNCENFCNLKYGHVSNISHVCSKTQDEHLCPQLCHLYEQSTGCKKYCRFSITHSGPHICESQKHICKGICALKTSTRQGCDTNCILEVNHQGECICKNQTYNHICIKKCILFDKANNCTEYCTLNVNHRGDCKCSIEFKLHKCKNVCSLNGKTRIKNNEKCSGNCGLYYGHKGKCICNRDIHLCNEVCELKNCSRGCNSKCNKPYGHAFFSDNFEHNCQVRHLCNKNCFYYIEMGNTKFCSKECNLEYGHEGKCLCSQYLRHACLKGKCFLFKKTRGCNEVCYLKYGHKGRHYCDINLEAHYCKEICRLCDKECGHVFNHNEEKTLKCEKCEGDICQLEKNIHLCGNVHSCQEICQKSGWCAIGVFSNVESQDSNYITGAGDIIPYKKVFFQERKKEKCAFQIRKNKLTHISNNHFCESDSHKCGFQCIQCEYYCTEKYGHKGLHEGNHGNIKNSSFYLTSNDKILNVKKGDQMYRLKEGDSAIMYFCSQYCREMGQGHTHSFVSKEDIKHEDVKFITSNKNFFTNFISSFLWGDSADYIYECKCSYFWEKILKFKGNFTNEEKKKFSLCSWKCKYYSHSSQNPEYCQLALWHEPHSIKADNEFKKEEDDEKKGLHKKKKFNYPNWVYKGHLFKCVHSIGIYTIFLIDQSGSMGNNNIRPINQIIRQYLDNRLGAAVDAIESYYKLRMTNSPKDKCALISFNNKAYEIFKDYYIDQTDIIREDCINNLKPNGTTYFKNAFEKGYEILQNLIEKKYDDIKPIIILLSDGLDMGSEETISFIRNVSHNTIL